MICTIGKIVLFYHGHRRFNMYNTLVNGVYHWLIGPNHDDHDFNILCFDFHTNRFQLLESPVRYSPFNHDIAEINGTTLMSHLIAVLILNVFFQRGRMMFKSLIESFNKI